MTSYTGIVGVEKLSDQHLIIASQPWPIASMEVTFRGGMWRLRWVGERAWQPTLYGEMGDATKVASRMVRQLAEVVWRRQFAFDQRYAVGQQQCPYRTGGTLCRRAPEGRTIWCDWHPHGVERAFT